MANRHISTGLKMPHQKRGFTLIELLVVVCIFSLLISMMLPVLATARQASRQCRDMSNLRQIMLGYTQHSIDQNGKFLYGYSPGSVNGKVVEILHDNRVYGPPVVNRYPWRLSPYISDVWDVIYSHSGSPEEPQSGDNDQEAFLKAYILSVSPSFGINSVYVGGHHSPFYKAFINKGVTTIPNTGGHVVFRDIEVHQPSSLITFTEAQRQGGGITANDTGHFWATPPNAAGAMWKAENKNWEAINTSRVIGLPKGRYFKETITAFLDCHIKTMNANELMDMSLWANQAKDNTYDIP